jgi:molybdopterin molybdotransferase
MTGYGSSIRCIAGWERNAVCSTQHPHSTPGFFLLVCDHMIELSEAIDRILRAVRPKEPAPVPLSEALGAILAEDVASPEDSPPFDKSMMDGYAVQAGDLAGETVLRVSGEITAGAVSLEAVAAGCAIRIMTGAPIPPGADAVVPIEWTEQAEGHQVRVAVRKVVRPGMNILRRGFAMRGGEIVLETGKAIRAQEVALLAEMGQGSPRVRTWPTVAILATGDELVDVDQPLGPGQIRNSNLIMLAAQVRQAGGSPRLLGIARDTRSDLAEKIRAGLDCDLFCLSGGVSAGILDLVPSELAAAGVEEIFHKVAIKPGKPVWFGMRPEQEDRAACAVFGLPGNPVSSMVCFELFVRTAMHRLVGLEPAGPTLREARMAAPFRHQSDRQTWFPAKMSAVHGELLVEPVGWKGSADLRSTVSANSSLLIPAGTVDWAAKARVKVLPWGRASSEI